MELLRCLLQPEQTPQSLSTPGGPLQTGHPDTATEIKMSQQSTQIRTDII